MAKPISKKSIPVRGGKMAQKKLIEGAGKISGKVAAKATAAKRKAAPKTVEQSIADIAEQVAAKLAESGTQMAQKSPGGVDKIADQVAARLGQTSNLAQQAMGSVDKIADLVAARLGQTSDLVQETLAKQVDKIVDLVAAKLGQTGDLAQQTLEMRVDEIADQVAAKISRSTGGAAQQKAQPSSAADKKVSKLSTVALNWKEVYYTNCPMVSASNIDQELGWAREEFKKIGVKYAYFRSRAENDWYPHYIHNLDNLIRFGGLFPPIHVHADLRRTGCWG